MTNTKKFLSVFLSLLMVFSAVSVAFVQFALPVYAAPVAADYDELASLIRDLRAENTDVLTVGGSGSNLTASYNDATGKMFAVAEKYYAIFSGLKPTGTINQNTASNRTATMINSTIKNQMQSKFTASELSDWRIVALLDSFIANANVNGNTNNSSSQTAPTITVTVNFSNAVLAYDSVDDLPDSVKASAVYKYTHSSLSYTSGSGCNQTTNYYVKINSVSETPSNISTTLIKSLSNTIAANASYYTATFAELLDTDEATLTAAKDALSTAYNNVINSTDYDGAAVYAKYFANYDTTGTIENIDAAIQIGAYKGLAQELQSKTELDISEYTYAELSTLYFDMQSKLDNYNSAPVKARGYLEENGYIDLDAVNAKFDEITNAYEIAYLRENLKPRIDANLELYATYDDDWTIATDGVEGIIAAAELEIDAVIADFNSRKDANFETVFGMTKTEYIETVLTPVTDSFARIREVNEFNLDFKAYQATYNSVFAPLTLNENSTQLLNILSARDGWVTELRAFADELAEYDAELAAKILTDAEAAMEAKIAQTYAALNAILENEINDAWVIYQAQAEATGLQINEVNMETYNTLRQSIGLIEVNVYDFLELTDNFDLSDETIEKYEALKSIILALNNYDPSRTLSAYKYNAETLDPIVRYVSEKDVIRDRDFTIQDEYYGNLIAIVDDLLTSGKLDELGLDLDIGALLDGIPEKVYTDKFVNTIMGALYPMLTELVRDKLRDMIPETYSVPIVGNINIYEKMGDLDDAFEKATAGLAPKKVGKYVNATKYPAIAAALKGVNTGEASGFMYKGATSDPEVFLNCWTAPEAKNELYRVVVDENDEPVLDENGEPTYELKFDWGIDATEGVDAKREAFLDAIDSALNALKPIFLSLLCNQTLPKRQIIDAELVNLLFTKINLTLDLGIKPNDGYNNALIPILEAMGVNEDALYDAKTFTSVRDIVEYGLLIPIADLFDQLKTAPLSKVLELLPNLTFAVQNGLILPLLHELKLDLDLEGGGCDTAASAVNDMIGGGVSVDLGEELDLADMLGIETFYEDILSMDGVLDLVLSLVNGDDEDTAEPAEGEDPPEGEEPAAPAPELKLPHLDGAKLAMLGTDVEWNDSYRSKSQIVYEGRHNIHANIIANKPQVMQFLLEYVLEAVKDDDFVPAILEMVNKDKPDEEKTELPEAVAGILDNIKANGMDAIAAIYELVHPVYRYTMPDRITWITESTITEADYESYWKEVEQSGNETLWTRSKAEYMAAHFSDFLDDVVVIFGEQLGGVDNLEAALNYLIGNLFKPETLNDLAGSIRDLLGGLELPEMLADLGLIEQVIDLTAWDDMTFDFAEGDKAAFKAGLAELLDPLAPLLGFILAEKDIGIGLLDLISVTGVGYNGYAYGLVPLLEALGATGVKSPEALIADPDNIVKNIIDPLFSVIDKIAADPMDFIETAIPAILYFDKVGGIQVGIEHLLVSVNVLLDIIRPIYDVDIYALVAEKLGVDLHFAETDPVNFLLMKLNELLAESGVAIEIDFTVESLSAQLNFTDPIKFTSVNGDDAYTIALSENGKVEFVTRTIDFAVDQIILGNNARSLIKIARNYITDEDQLYLILAILQSIDHLDASVDNKFGINDVALSTIFWIFFGADSVTDATADWFFRYKEGAGAIELLIAMVNSSTSYVSRAAFAASEFLGNEFPHLMQALSQGIPNLMKPFDDYTDDDIHYLTGILARLIVVFSRLFRVIRSLFAKL